MVDANRRLVECPTCHSEVAYAARCEVCGAALPETIFDNAADEYTDPLDATDHAYEPPSEELEPDNYQREESDAVGEETAPASEPESAVDHDPTETPSPAPPPPSEPEDKSEPDPIPAPPPAPSPTPAPKPPKSPDNSLWWKGLFADFDFTGRMAQGPFWKITGIRMALGAFLFILVLADSGGGPYGDEIGDVGILAFLVMLAMAPSGYAQSTRRLHDAGLSGWLNLVSLLPYIGIVAMIVLWVKGGTTGSNQYGPEPGDTETWL